MKRRSLLPWYIFHDSGQIWFRPERGTKKKKLLIDSVLVPGNPAEQPTFSIDLMLLVKTYTPYD